MILYTIMPQESIFPTSENEYGSNQIMINYDGIPLLVEQTSNHYQVIRVMSSDPSHYLDERCTPGTKISLFS